MAIFTAIDGTLVDSRTFEAGPNRALIRRLRSEGIPVVPVTVMTLDETAPLAAELGLRDPMILEAGGAIARRNGPAWSIEPCGPDSDSLLDTIREVELLSGAHLLVYSALPERDAALLSGREGARLRQSLRRRFSEPFVIEHGDARDIEEAAESIGYTVRRGRRFLYLCRASDESDAFVRVRDELRCEIAIGLGGSALDADFLARADVAVIIPNETGEPDPELVAMLPNARIAMAPAPQSWADAVESSLSEIARAVTDGV